MNKVLIIGRIVRDPVISVTSSGIKRAYYTIAVNRIGQENQADYIPVVSWRQDAEVIERFVLKGSLISVEGRFTSSTLKNNDGSFTTRYEVTSERIELLENKAQTDARRQGKTGEFTPQAKQPTPSTSQPMTFEGENNTQQDSKDDFDWDFDV